MADFTRYTPHIGRAILKKRKAGKTLDALSAEYEASTRSISNWIVKATEEKKKAKKPRYVPKPLRMQKKGQKKTVNADAKTAEVVDVPQTAMVTKEIQTQMLLEEIAYLHWWKEGELKGYVRRLLEEFVQCKEPK